MNKEILKRDRKVRRQNRIRVKISGTEARPRLTVFRSNRGMFVQLIDDNAGKTLVSAHSREIKDGGNKSATSLELGKLLAKKAIEKKIVSVVFDKGSYKYHGRVKAVADGAREGGLAF
jgi:large subunit ribosomal protein L18